MIYMNISMHRIQIIANMFYMNKILPIIKEESRKVDRPWGYYNILVKTSTYLIKKIVILPKKSISLQMHNYRSEHWIVLSGQAKIIIDNDEMHLEQSQSAFVPSKKKHKITNDTLSPLIIIETQLGSILSEDDIIRYDVDYTE